MLPSSATLPARRPPAVHDADGAAGTILVARESAARFRVTGIGRWSPAYVDDHFGQLGAQLAGARSPSARLRVLVDLRHAAVQGAETARRIAWWTSSIYQAEDRVAILVASSLVKMQMRRVAIIATRELFLSEAAAEMWLSA